MKIRVWAELMSVNATAETIIEDVPDDATDDEIEDVANEAAAELYTWNWEKVEED